MSGSKIRLYGSTSGYVELAPPAVSPDATLTLPSTFAGIGSNVVSVTKTDTFSASVAQGAFTDVTGFEVTITPTSATSKIFVIASVNAGASATNQQPNVAIRLTRSGTAIAVPTSVGSKTPVTSATVVASNEAAGQGNVTATFLDSPATTSAVTYKVQLGNAIHAAGTTTLNLNRSTGIADFSYTPMPVSTLTVIEVAA